MFLDSEPYMLNEDTHLLCILELDPTLKRHASNFLLYGGILAGHSDGHFTLEELAYLSESLSPLFDTPEAIMKALLSPNMAVLSFEKSMGWLRHNGSEINLSLLRCLSGLVASDHMLRPEEVRFLQNTCKGLGINSEDGRTILSQALMAKRAQTTRKRNMYRNTMPLFTSGPIVNKGQTTMA
ncbi:MAG: hypothetical protein JXX14_08055 [Deltaproteobacteria bacterium]|nr:hypothetical protein [Deltaproteobacteria bacterium]